MPNVEQKVDGLEHRFDGLEQRFDGLEHRFDGLEQKFDNLEKKMDKRFDQVDKRFERADEKFDRLLGIVIGTQEDIRDMYRRLKPLEEVKDQIFDKIDAFMRTLQIHDVELVALRGADQRISERVDVLEKQRA